MSETWLSSPKRRFFRVTFPDSLPMSNPVPRLLLAETLLQKRHLLLAVDTCYRRGQDAHRSLRRYRHVRHGAEPHRLWARTETGAAAAHAAEAHAAEARAAEPSQMDSTSRGLELVLALSPAGSSHSCLFKPALNFVEVKYLKYLE